MDVAVLALLTVAAFVTSTISAILGMAGGITLLGVMTAFLPAPQVVPIHGIVQLFSNTSRTLVFLKHVRWRVFATFAGPMIVGTIGAAQLWSGSKLAWFRPVIGLFILAFLIWRRKSPKLKNPPMWVYAPLGLFVGFLAIFVGATGPFLAPFFLRDDFEPTQIIATKAVCQSLAHLAKIPTFLAVGFAYHEHWTLLGLLVTAVMLGTVLGKRLLERIPKDRFLIAFEVTLGMLAVYLIGAWARSLL